MWKCVSKSLRVIFEKNHYKCCNVPATKVTQDCKPRNCLSPVFAERLNKYYDFFKSCCGEESSKDKQRKDRRAKKGFSLNFMQCRWFEALSLSVIVGWYCILPNKRIFCPASYEHKPTNYIEHYLSNILVPNTLCYVLPKVNAIKGKQKSDVGKDLKPEVLEEAHVQVLGSLSNWMGTECMQSGKHKEAVVHFKEAAEVNHPAAFFNLGICHEMGLGTDQSFQKAAEMYKKASDLGHATAMYNLGVFYVHGWGGLEPDVNRARELFQTAAGLGQVDARKLLHMKEEPADPEPSTSGGRRRSRSISETLNTPPRTELADDKLHRKVIKEVDPSVTDPTFLWYQVLNITMEDIQFDKRLTKKVGQIGSVDSGVLDLSSDDELDIFV